MKTDVADGHVTTTVSGHYLLVISPPGRCPLLFLPGYQPFPMSAAYVISPLAPYVRFLCIGHKVSTHMFTRERLCLCRRKIKAIMRSDTSCYCTTHYDTALFAQRGTKLSS